MTTLSGTTMTQSDRGITTMIKSGEQSTLKDFDGCQTKLSYFITEDVNQLEIDLAKKHCKK
jgi:hypothetical protein